MTNSYKNKSSRWFNENNWNYSKLDKYLSIILSIAKIPSEIDQNDEENEFEVDVAKFACHLLV